MHASRQGMKIPARRLGGRGLGYAVMRSLGFLQQPTGLPAQAVGPPHHDRLQRPILGCLGMLGMPRDATGCPGMLDRCVLGCSSAPEIMAGCNLHRCVPPPLGDLYQRCCRHNHPHHNHHCHCISAATPPLPVPPIDMHLWTLPAAAAGWSINARLLFVVRA